MQKWEYKQVNVPMDINEKYIEYPSGGGAACVPQHKDKAKEAWDTIFTLGTEGWEICTSIPIIGSLYRGTEECGIQEIGVYTQTYLIVLKRPFP